MPLKLALIGCGRIARGRHLPGYAAIKQKEADLFDLVAVVDADRERAEAAPRPALGFQPNSPKVYTDVAQLLEDETLDAADVCTPHFLHHTVGIQCPRPVSRCRSRNPWRQRQGHPAAIAASSAPAGCSPPRRTSGACPAPAPPAGSSTRGAPSVSPSPSTPSASRRAARARHHRGSGWRRRRRTGAPAVGLAQRRLHERRRPRDGQRGPLLDTIRYLYGDVESSYGRVWQANERHAWKGDDLVRIETEDTFMATINFESGATGTWSVSSQLPGEQFANVVYYGAEGSIVEQDDPFHGPRITAPVVLRDGTTARSRSTTRSTSGARRSGSPARLPARARGRLRARGLRLPHRRARRPPARDRRRARPPRQGHRARHLQIQATGRVVRVQDILEGKVDAYQGPINARWAFRGFRTHRMAIRFTLHGSQRSEPRFRWRSAPPWRRSTGTRGSTSHWAMSRLPAAPKRWAAPLALLPCALHRQRGARRRGRAPEEEWRVAGRGPTEGAPGGPGGRLAQRHRHPPPRRRAQGDTLAARRRAHRAARSCRRRTGLRLGMEFLGVKTLRLERPHVFVQSMAEANQILVEAGTKHVGITLDRTTGTPPGTRWTPSSRRPPGASSCCTSMTPRTCPESSSWTRTACCRARA